MVFEAINAMKRNRAAFAREVEYMREMAEDDAIDERTEAADSDYAVESVQDLHETYEAVMQLPADDVDADKEISTIMEATEDLTFDQMVGLNNEVGV